MEVKRVSIAEMDPKQFIREHWLPGIPLVFTDATTVWQAHGTFTPDWFRTHYGGRRTVVNGQEYSMNEILDLVEGKDTSRPVPYPCKFHVPTQLPELMPIPTCPISMASPTYEESAGSGPGCLPGW